MLKFKLRMRQKYSDEVSKELNEYFNTNKKIEHCEHSINYIKECLKHEKPPKFSQVNVDKQKYNSNFIQKIRFEITDEELRNKTRHKKQLEKVLEKHRKLPSYTNLAEDDWAKLEDLVHEKREKIREEAIATQKEKRTKLGIDTTVQINSSNINKRRNNIDKIEAIENKENI